MSENKGWIKISKQIQEHWIWKDPVKFKCWIDILITVNFEDKQVVIGNKLFLCKRGESLLSLQSWADQWRLSKGATRNILSLLQSAHMITLENCTQTTRLTVCNYDTYQCGTHTDETQKKRVVYTTKEDKNILSKDSIIKKRRDDFKNELSAYLPTYGKDMLNEFYAYWIELNKSKTKMKFESEKTWELNLRLAKWKNIGEQFSRKQQKNYSDTPPLMADN